MFSTPFTTSEASTHTLAHPRDPVSSPCAKALDLCAGAGGASLGLQRAGYDVLGVELDPEACATHRAQVGPCVEADLWHWHPSAPVQLVSAGIPCQSHSYAGKFGGTRDPRGQLYAPMLRIADEADAQVLLVENVPGMRAAPSQTPGQSAFREVLVAMQAAGWHVAHGVLNAADYGVPQTRRRLFFVGFRDPAVLARFRWPAPTHAAPGNLLGLPAWVTLREALGLKEAASAERSLDAPCGTILGNRGGIPLGEHGQRQQLRAALERLERPAPTVLAGCKGLPGGEPSGRASRRPLAAVATALADAGLLDRPGTTVTHTATLARAGHHVQHQQGAVRLTLEQLTVLQGLPAGFTFHGRTVTSRHRQCGNALPPALAEALGRSILWALEERA